MWMTMDNKEAIFWLKQIKDKYIHGGDEDFDRRRCEALDTAIEHLQKTEKEQSRIGDDPFRHTTL